MMVTCMNDPGTGPTPDPLFNPSYSQFCYEIPYMPGQTQYMDTPVVPTSAFAEGYNPPDCAYPDATPAIKSVSGDTLTPNAASGSKTGGAGPWLSATGLRNLTITALGDQIGPNDAYSGPAASTAPYNQKFITRHYGFGAIAGTVTVGGVALTGVSWTDTVITGSVPASAITGTGSGTVPLCTIQQRPVATNGSAWCGELVITSSTGRQSIDTVTITIGGKKPTYISGENASNNAIQAAIDAAISGDEIIVGPGTYNEMLLMWKPVRLQGVAAASVTVNANTHPAGKVDIWRRQVNCLFGLALDGAPLNPTNPSGPPTHPYDPTGTYSCASTMQGQIDPIPLEPIIGWDANLNGNLSELLQEPTLMGAYEGAGITVLAKGVQDAITCSANGTPCTPLTNSTADCSAYPSNFLCNPSRVDGMSFTNSSQGGGGIFLHGWNHYTEVSKNRVSGNAGTLTGGITVGQAEAPDPTLSGTDALPLALDTNVNIHHNAVTFNASYGDELNTTTPSSAGGVTFCPGSDHYNFSYNWVCGNLSSGDGGGFAHYGLSFNGNIAHNAFLFNQSTNPTLTTWGGGVVIMGAAPDGTVSENSLVDIDAAPQLSDGVGPGLTIDANLIMGNTAESGSGGGLRLQHINGNDVLNNPSAPSHWFGVSVTNNVIVNNVAGWAGGGVSIQDAVKVDFRNNTVVSNDTTASAGVLFDTLGAPNSNIAPPGCQPITGVGCSNPVTNSNFQPAGLETHPHSLLLSPAFTNPNVVCPTGHPNCTTVSILLLANNIVWQNRSFPPSTVGNS